MEQNIENLNKIIRDLKKENDVLRSSRDDFKRKYKKWKQRYENLKDIKK
jgi:hypothetical protein